MFSYFKKFKALVDNQKSKTIKCLRINNIGEFYSGEFNQFCNEFGIARKLMVPKTPQQNDFFEHMNRIIVEWAICMLNTAGLE